MDSPKNTGIKDINTVFFDNTLLLILNENAHAAGLIDEKTKVKISNEIQSGERLKMS